MKKLICAALTLTTLNVFAGEGSGGGNGGGGNGRGQSFGKIVLPIDDATKDAHIADLAKRLTESGITNHDRRKDPSSIAKILLGLSQEGSVHSAGSGEKLNKNECPKEKTKNPVYPPVEVKDKFKYLDSKGNPLKLGDLCRSSKLADGYGAFFEFLRAVFGPDAKLTAVKYAIERAVEIKNAPIGIRFFEKGLKTKTKNGLVITENAWFDAEHGYVGIAPQTDYESGAQALVSRGSTALLAHELTHAYTAAVMGGYEKNHIWHDFSAALSNDKRFFAFRTAFARNAYDVQTDAYAAFVESFSNMVEPHGAFQMHPSIAEEPMAHFFKRDEKDDRYFSFIDQKYLLSRERLLANEAYVSTAFSVFSARPFVKRDELINYAGISPFVHDDDTVKIRLMKALEATTQDRSASDQPLLVRLFMKYDSMSQGDSEEGWRFLREFYNYDYKTKRDIRGDFSKVSHSDGGVESLGYGIDLDAQLMTNAAVPPMSLWSPYADRLTADAQKAAERLAGQAISATELLRQIDSLLSESRNSWKTAVLNSQRLRVDMNERRARYLELTKSFKSEGDRFDFASRVQSNLTNLDQDIDGSSVDVILSSLLEGKTDDLYKSDSFGHSLLDIRRLAALRARVASRVSTSPDDAGHVRDLKAFLALKPALERKEWLFPVLVFESFDVETGR